MVDINTAMRVYLVTLYTALPAADLTTLISKDLATRTGNYNARWNALMAAARV